MATCYTEAKPYPEAQETKPALEPITYQEPSDNDPSAAYNGADYVPTEIDSYTAPLYKADIDSFTIHEPPIDKIDSNAAPVPSQAEINLNTENEPQSAEIEFHRSFKHFPVRVHLNTTSAPPIFDSHTSFEPTRQTADINLNTENEHPPAEIESHRSLKHFPVQVHLNTSSAPPLSIFDPDTSFEPPIETDSNKESKPLKACKCRDYYTKTCEVKKRKENCEIEYIDECNTIYKEKCEDKKAQDCETIYEKKCTDEKKKVCETVVKTKVINEKRRECETIYKTEIINVKEQECETVNKTRSVYFETKQECITTYTEECKPVVKLLESEPGNEGRREKCVKIPKKECKNVEVPKEGNFAELNCKFVNVPKEKKVPEEKCKYVEVPKEKQVPEQKCKYIDVPQCYHIPKVVCKDYTVPKCQKYPEVVCKKVPKENCQYSDYYQLVQHTECQSEVESYITKYKTKYEKKCKQVEVPKCKTEFTEECIPERETKCEKVNKQECVDEKKQECKTEFKTINAKKKVCRTTYTEECKSNDRYNKECRKIPKETCKYVDFAKKFPVEKCQIVTVPKCKNVPKKECKTLTVPKCKKVPKELCLTEYKEDCYNEPIQVPEQVKVTNCVWPNFRKYIDSTKC